MTSLPNTIRRINGSDKGAFTYYPVIVVGAGESGIAMGCRLKEKLGFNQFKIFERQTGIGGTWWINRYPGVVCDAPAIFYSFSFAPNAKWSTYFPRGPEIQEYFQAVCDKYQLNENIQFNTDVTETRWLEDEELWEVHLTHLVPGAGDLSSKDRQQRAKVEGFGSVYIRHEVVKAKIVVSAAGGLVEPNAFPLSIPGREDFQGKIFHSARWDDDANLNDKDVIVIGTGCSAAQFVPALTQVPFNARSVTQIMRSPPWVAPQSLPPFGQEKWEKWSSFVFSWFPLLARFLRLMMFVLAEIDFYRIFHNKPWNAKARERMEADLLSHLKNTVPEKYQEILTPNYSVGCKRRIFDATWFRGLNDPKITLTTQPLTSLQLRGATLGPGRNYPDPKDTTSKAPIEEIHIPADIIILANGFELTTWLHPLKVRGKGGAIMQDVWDERGGAQAYMGATMDGFPNFFIIFGPNTATGHSSVILASENMVNYSLKFIKQILNGNMRTVEVKKEAEIAWTKDIQAELKKTVFNSGCNSWYKTANGWNATVYPYSQIDYTLRCMFPRWSHYNLQYTTKGTIRKWVWRFSWIAGLAVLFLCSVFAPIRREGRLSWSRNT